MICKIHEVEGSEFSNNGLFPFANGIHVARKLEKIYKTPYWAPGKFWTGLLCWEGTSLDLFTGHSQHWLANINEANYENTIHNEKLTVYISIYGDKILQLILVFMKCSLLNFHAFLEIRIMCFNRATFDFFGAMFIQPSSFIHSNVTTFFSVRYTCFLPISVYTKSTFITLTPRPFYESTPVLFKRQMYV